MEIKQNTTEIQNTYKSETLRPRPWYTKILRILYTTFLACSSLTSCNKTSKPSEQVGITQQFKNINGASTNTILNTEDTVRSRFIEFEVSFKGKDGLYHIQDCSGVSVVNGQNIGILTAAHCLERSNSKLAGVKVKGKSNDCSKIGIAKGENDIALIRSANNCLLNAPIGDDVYINENNKCRENKLYLGRTNNDEWKFDSTPETYNQNGRFIAVFNTEKGNSGSGIYCKTPKGNALIGVLSERKKTGNFISIALIKEETIKELNRKAGIALSLLY